MHHACLKGGVERKVSRTQREKILRAALAERHNHSMGKIGYLFFPSHYPPGLPSGRTQWKASRPGDSWGQRTMCKMLGNGWRDTSIIWRVSRMFVFIILFMEIENHIIWWGFLRLELRNWSAHGRRKQELWEAHFLIPHTFQEKSDFCRHFNCLVRSQE